MASLQDRIVGALQLKPATFEEVESDTTATSQAAIVVLAAAVSVALGNSFRSFSATATVMTIVFTLVAWAVSSFVVMIVGTRILPGKNTQADYGQLLRVMGFAQAPCLFGIVAVIPIVGLVISFGLWIWQLVAMVIGVRQALDYEDTIKAVVVCVVAMVIQWVFLALVALLGIGAAVAGAAMGS